MLAEPVVALTDLPAFDTSSMDGWAVCGEGPWTVVGEVLAGHAPELDLAPGQCCVIATGAAVPAGATAIVRRENGLFDGSRVAADHVAGADIRPAGEECRAGDVLAAEGTEVGPALIGLFAAAGVDEVRVRATTEGCGGALRRRTGRYRCGGHRPRARFVGSTVARLAGQDGGRGGVGDPGRGHTRRSMWSGSGRPLPALMW